MSTVGSLKRGRIILVAAVAALACAASAHAQQVSRVEVVVLLKPPPLAQSPVRSLGATVGSPAARRYVAGIAQQQDALIARIHAAIPSARVRWRYRLVLDGIAVVVPEGSLRRLARIQDVASVEPAIRYAPRLDVSVPLIGAPTLWGPTLSTAGQGMKIGIIDDGLDSSHPFFKASGYSYPAGFPRGDKRFTTPKVIVARSFPAPAPLASHPDVPFDPDNSDHATHVSGIAAGDDGTIAVTGGSAVTLAGVAPRAYLGNYRVMSVLTPAVGIDGSSPEIVAGIEAAVADGMNVINLSLGEPEVNRNRDLVVRAIDGAAKLGVVPTIAAGNDYAEYGDGSVNSPASAPDAITVAASGTGKGFGVDQIADFSSAGPTPASLQLKPDVTAPGVNILSSLPQRVGLWASWQGTSMAAPHVAGAAALLLQRHPGWTVAQVKSALVLTGQPVYDGTGTREVSPLREGGGRIDLPAADQPLVFAAPTSVSFGLVRPGAKLSQEVALTDAGGGSGQWTAAVDLRTSVEGVTITVPSQLTVPSALVVAATVSPTAKEGDEAGFVVLHDAAGDVRRIPFWLHVERPRLGSEPHTLLKRPGLYKGDTRGKAARVTTYRYPVRMPAAPYLQSYPGPEQVFRFSVRAGIANAGVVVTSNTPDVVPHVVSAGDENRVTSYAGLPLNIDPYRSALNVYEGVAGVDLPAAGSYDAVFDTPTGRRPAAYTFRFWVNDLTPPTVRLLTPHVAAAKPLAVHLSDTGAGVDPHVLVVTLDGRSIGIAYDARTGILRIPTLNVPAGKHRLGVEASDYQEAKNMEATGAVLPNTRFFKATVTVG